MFEGYRDLLKLFSDDKCTAESMQKCITKFLLDLDQLDVAVKFETEGYLVIGLLKKLVDISFKRDDIQLIKLIVSTIIELDLVLEDRDSIMEENLSLEEPERKEDEEVGQFEELFGSSYETILLDFFCDKKGAWLSPKSIRENIGAGWSTINPQAYLDKLVKNTLIEKLEHADNYRINIKHPITKAILDKIEVLCPFCKSTDTVKDGTRKGKTGVKQRYQCNKCEKRFIIVGKEEEEEKKTVETARKDIDIFSEKNIKKEQKTEKELLKERKDEPEEKKFEVKRDVQLKEDVESIIERLILAPTSKNILSRDYNPPIRKDAVEYLLRHLPSRTLCTNEICELLSDFYRKVLKNTTVSDNSLRVYSSAYTNFFTDRFIFSKDEPHGPLPMERSSKRYHLIVKEKPKEKAVETEKENGKVDRSSLSYVAKYIINWAEKEDNDVIDITEMDLGSYSMRAIQKGFDELRGKGLATKFTPNRYTVKRCNIRK